MQGAKMQSPSLGIRKQSIIPRAVPSPISLGSNVSFKTLNQYGRPSRKSSVEAMAKANAGNLPWQVAMSEIKKRRDIKSIMSKSRVIGSRITFFC